MKAKTPENYEARSFTGTVEFRKSDDGGGMIRGLAAVFNKLSENLGGFREIIEPGAFDDTNMDDVRGLFNHDSNFVLGRTKSESLRLTRTEDGLQYEIDMPDTRTIQDLVMAPIERGDIDQSSFGFIIGRGNDSWDENEDGVLIRTIHKIQRLFDVSPVTFPAYPDATVGARSMENWKTECTQHAKVLEKRAENGKTAQRLLRKAQLSGID